MGWGEEEDGESAEERGVWRSRGDHYHHDDDDDDHDDDDDDNYDDDDDDDDDGAIENDGQNDSNSDKS